MKTQIDFAFPLAACALIGCNSNSAVENQNEGEQQAAAVSDEQSDAAAETYEEGDLTEGPIWSTSSDVDPMTDVSSSVATMMVRGPQFDTEVVVRCDNQGRATYTFTSFDKNGAYAENSSRFTERGVTIPFQVRVDDKQPVTHSSAMRYTNQATLSSTYGPYFYSLPSLEAAAASRVSVRLPLKNGDQTFILDQEDAAFKGAVSTCTTGYRQLLARMAQEAEQREQAQARSEAQEIERAEVEQGRQASDAASNAVSPGDFNIAVDEEEN